MNSKRKNPLQSKNKVRTMMELFESKVDDEIVIIDIKANRIQGKEKVYNVDIATNRVTELYKCNYKFEDRGDDWLE